MYGKHQSEKEYPGCSKFNLITLIKPVRIDPFSTYVIKTQSPTQNSHFSDMHLYVHHPGQFWKKKSEVLHLDLIFPLLISRQRSEKSISMFWNHWTIFACQKGRYVHSAGIPLHLIPPRTQTPGSSRIPGSATAQRPTSTIVRPG